MNQTARQQDDTLHWTILATHLNGAADSRKYDHIDTTTILKRVLDGNVFQYLTDELAGDVDYAIAKLSDAQKHDLVKHWGLLAQHYETSQFHVSRSGLSLLVAYLLYLIQNRHVPVPT
jgi:hypothetical protein